MPRRDGHPTRRNGYRFRTATWLLAAALCPAGLVASEESPEPEKKAHPLAPAIRVAKASRKVLESVEDFEAIFKKRELVKGRMYPHTMSIKFRREPFSVYLRFEKPHEGREVLYFEGRNDGKLLAHETGLKGVVGTVSLSPTSREALSEGRHPITKIGIPNMLDAVIEQWEEETKYGEADLKYYPNAKLSDRDPKLLPMECKVIETSHPRPRKQFRFHRTRLWIDKKTNLPVRVEQHGFPPRPGAEPPLIAEYTYWNVRTNIGLEDVDFDPENPEYDF